MKSRDTQITKLSTKVWKAEKIKSLNYQQKYERPRHSNHWTINKSMKGRDTQITKLSTKVWFGWLCWGLMSQSTIFQSCRDGAIASWVSNQYFRGVKCLAQGHNTAAVGLEPRTSRSGVRHSTTEPPRSPQKYERPKHTSLNYQQKYERPKHSNH